MLVYLYSSLFDSPAQTLVNTVNTVGVMGKGIAKSFREKYPAMFREYKKLCDTQQLHIGRAEPLEGGRKLDFKFSNEDDLETAVVLGIFGGGSPDVHVLLQRFRNYLRGISSTWLRQRRTRVGGCETFNGIAFGKSHYSRLHPQRPLRTGVHSRTPRGRKETSGL
jgi:hypothetical protein